MPEDSTNAITLHHFAQVFYTVCLSVLLILDFQESALRLSAMDNIPVYARGADVTSMTSVNTSFPSTYEHSSIPFLMYCNDY
jgi:hypothetical protein